MIRDMTIGRPEIVVAFVGALGTPRDAAIDYLKSGLETLGYKGMIVGVSKLLSGVAGLPELETSPENQRIKTHMEAGTELCVQMQRGDAMALLAMLQIRELRKKRTSDPMQPAQDVAYILTSLKRPDEVKTLRKVYGDHFYLVGTWANREKRTKDLSKKLASSDAKLQGKSYLAEAEELITIDESEEHRWLGQNVRKTFPLADFFVDASTPTGACSQIDRFIKLLFGHPCITPTRDEVGMFHAEAAKLRSGALGRQVGAALLREDDGDLLAVGMNEVPRSGGGHYWAGDSNDSREYVLGEDSSDVHKRILVRQVLKALLDAKWISSELGNDLNHLVKEALKDEVDESKGTRDLGPLETTWLLNLTEFGRDVHAEMSAIVSAARNGVSLRGSHLCCTTFPCHNCTKHIIAAGIKRVVYIEPYEKSFAGEFHADAIKLDSATPTECCYSHVRFDPFSGVAPRRYQSWFTMATRKDEATGKAIPWEPQGAVPRFRTVDSGYTIREFEAVSALVELGIVERPQDEEPN